MGHDSGISNRRAKNPACVEIYRRVGHRLLAFEQERVTFRWKNYAHGGKPGQMTLVATQFLRRFFLHVLLHALATLSTISLQPFDFAGALPALDWVPNCHSNPITQRVCRKRQRLPPSLLIENASGVSFRLPGNSLPQAFPIKASDNPGVNRFGQPCRVTRDRCRSMMSPEPWSGQSTVM